MLNKISYLLISLLYVLGSIGVGAQTVRYIVAQGNDLSGLTAFLLLAFQGVFLYIGIRYFMEARKDYE